MIPYVPKDFRAGRIARKRKKFEKADIQVQ